MSDIKIEINKGTLLRLQRLLDEVAKEAPQRVDDVIMQTMRFALQSARKETHPKRSSKELPKKYTIRPLEKMPASMGHWYVQKGKDKPFKVNKNFTKAELKRKKLDRVTKGIRKWEKGKGWTWIPWVGKKEEGNKRFKIPYAGLARDSWGRMIPLFPNSKGRAGKDESSQLNKRVRTNKISRARKRFLYGEAVNTVTYGDKIAPGVARIALHRAVNRIYKEEARKAERAIERRFNR